MSIASRIEAIEQHLTDDYNVLEVAGADLTNVDKNILNLKTTWQERLLYFMNNGTQEVWDNWEKVVGEGTTITLNNTEEAPMKIVLKGNTSQEETPTPETPQDIHVVSGDNSIVVCGKNLINFEDIQYTITNGYYKDFDTGIVFTEDMVHKMFSISYDIEITNYTGTPTSFFGVTGRTTNPPGMQAQMVAKTNNISSSKIRVKVENVTIGEYVGQHLILRPAGFSAPITGTFSVSNVQMEWGTTSSDFEPYQSNSHQLTLPSGMELCKIGTYQDRIYKSNIDNNWYLHKEVGKVVLNGSENDWSYPSANRFNLDNYINNYLKSGGNIIYLSNYYKAFEQTGTNGEFNTLVSNENYGFNATNSSAFNLRFKDTRFTSVNDFKTWLSTHNTTIYYVLTTPTDTQITDATLISQLNALAKSYTSQTNISQENNDMPFILDITALKEM